GGAESPRIEAAEQGGDLRSAALAVKARLLQLEADARAEPPPVDLPAFAEDDDRSLIGRRCPDRQRAIPDGNRLGLAPDHRREHCQAEASEQVLSADVQA